MKQLFWKEWYELRLLPLMSAVCVAMLIFGAKVFSAASDPTHRFTFGDTLLPLAGTWMFCALLAGAGLFAQEVGSGGLQFLSALPTSRRRLWCVKVLTGLGMLLLSVIACAVAWAVIDIVVFRAAFFAFFDTVNSAIKVAPAYTMQIASGMLLSMLASFSVGLAVSPFLDRSISAVVAALLVGIAYFGALLSLTGLYENHYIHSGDWVFIILVALSLPVLLTVSYWTFTRGESLRSARRFRVGALAGLASLAVAGAMFLAGFTMNLW